MDTARMAETSRFEVVLMVNTARMAETRRIIVVETSAVYPRMDTATMAMAPRRRKASQKSDRQRF